VGRRRSKPVGRVRLSVPVPLGLYLSSHLGPLLDRCEHLSIDLVLRDGVCDLVEEGIDLEVRLGPVADSALISRRIGSTTAFLVAAPQYLQGRTLPAHPRDLQEHECIVYHRWGQDDVWWFSSPEGNVSVSVRGRFRANNATAVYRAALDGRGIAHAAIMKAGRKVYRAALIEPVLVIVLLFQVTSGVRLAWAWSSLRSDAFRIFQIGSGAYLACFILTHMNSALVSARAVHKIDTDWSWASGAPVGLIHDAWNIRLLPHYALGALFVIGHLSSGLRVVMLAHGVRPAVADRVWAAGLTAGAVISAAIVCALCGVRV
jgi:LysR substrate binding domain